MKRSFARQVRSIALAAVAGCIVGSPALAAELEATATEATYHAADEPLFDAAPVAYDALQQPGDGMETMGMGGMAAPAPAARSSTARRGPTGSRQANIRLASVPNMYGDFGMAMGQVQAIGQDGQGIRRSLGMFDIPTAGGSRRVKIGENNTTLPTDRVFVMYNHFHNVFQVDEMPLVPLGPRNSNQTHIDRYTVGFEKMFLDDLWSVEVRMPFNSSFDYQGSAVAVDGGSVGNLAIILKNLLYLDDSTTVAGGLGIDTPTGSDVSANFGGLDVDFNNDAVHLLPWLGFRTTDHERYFVTAFAQIDIATGGNEIIATQFDRSLGFYNEQNLLYLDLSVGTWLYNAPEARRLTSVALIGEVHYTTTLQDTDVVAQSVQGTDFAISNVYNRQDIVNGTVALQFEIANTSNFRVAGVAPLSNDDDRRLFDAEVQFQFNRRF